MKSPPPDPSGMRQRLEQAEQAVLLGTPTEKQLLIVQMHWHGYGCTVCGGKR